MKHKNVNRICKYLILQNFHVLLKLFGLAIIKQKGNYEFLPFQFTILNNFISCLN